MELLSGLGAGNRKIASVKLAGWCWPDTTTSFPIDYGSNPLPRS